MLDGGVAKAAQARPAQNEVAQDGRVSRGRRNREAIIDALVASYEAGSLRPSVTGTPLYLDNSAGFLNPAAFTAPAPGQWGNAARSSITGPAQF